jgi:hypothetical protein
VVFFLFWYTASMTTDFQNSVNSTADEIISLSKQLDNEIETWGDVVARVPDSTSKGVSAGFISKPTATSGIEIVADVQAPSTEHTARLRLWAIETVKDNDGNERFNNVQLTYGLGYEKARKLVEQSSALTRDNLSALAHDPEAHLDSLVISDLTGRDAASEQLLGKRYDFGPDELNTITEDLSSELVAAMHTVLERLKKSAAGK